MRHFDKIQILTDKQHGFRARLSCETQLISTIQETANKMTQKGQTDVILHKFAKALYKVPHHRLLHKLNYYGVGESTLCWIESFFSSSSKGSNLSCWMVPNLQKQMYCLKARKRRGQTAVHCGTLLFLAFIDDLQESTNHSDARLFTDHCLLYRHVTSSQDQDLLQEDLSALERWEERNLANEIPSRQMHNHQNQHQQETDLVCIMAVDTLRAIYIICDPSHEKGRVGCHIVKFTFSAF